MAKFPIIIILIAFFAVVLFPATAISAEILGPKVIIQNNDIIVNTGLIYLDDIEATMRSGIEKEIVFTIELFRVWSFWPDEFVVSKKVQRIIKYDNLRGEYHASSYDGISRVSKKVTDFNVMKAWTFSVDEVNLANMRELEPGSYYLRVVVESKSRELPRVIGLLMLFIPEVEMSLAKESKPFDVGEAK